MKFTYKQNFEVITKDFPFALNIYKNKEFYKTERFTSRYAMNKFIFSGRLKKEDNNV